MYGIDALKQGTVRKLCAYKAVLEAWNNVYRKIFYIGRVEII